MVRDMAVVSAATTRNPDSLPSSQESTRAPFCGSGPQRQRSGGRKQGACQTGGAPRRRAGARRAPGIIGDIARRAARPFCQESTHAPFFGMARDVRPGSLATLPAGLRGRSVKNQPSPLFWEYPPWSSCFQQTLFRLPNQFRRASFFLKFGIATMLAPTSHDTR